MMSEAHWSNQVQLRFSSTYSSEKRNISEIREPKRAFRNLISKINLSHKIKLRQAALLLCWQEPTPIETLFMTSTFRYLERTGEERTERKTLDRVIFLLYGSCGHGSGSALHSFYLLLGSLASWIPNYLDIWILDSSTFELSNYFGFYSFLDT